MSRGFSSVDDPSHEGKTNTWLTPLEIISALGKFDLDPCGFPGHRTADRLIVQPKGCGLRDPWRGRVWLNPPYGRKIGLWLTKMEKHGNGIALVFARPETNWFQNLDADMFYFLRGRISFLNQRKETETNAGCGSVLIAWGTKNATAIARSGLSGRIF